MKTAVVLTIFACALSACAHFGEPPPQPGAPLAAVKERLGQPTNIYADGDVSVLEYATGPMGQYTWMARIGADGRLISYEQVLTSAKFGTVKLGKDDKASILRTFVRRPFLRGATPYIGTQWMMVTRRFCQFVCHDRKADRFKAFYRNTFIADEGFFQTVMKNIDQHGRMINDDMRAIDWIPDGDIKLRPRTFTLADAPMLKTSPDLFARKFDAEVDDGILVLLEDWVAEASAPLDPPAVMAA